VARTDTSRSRVATAIVALALVADVRIVAAAPSRKRAAESPPAAEPAAEMPAAVDPALASAQTLYAEGLTHYETLDYDLAIASWKDALDRLRNAERDTPEKVDAVTAARTAIVYNIARAQQRAFDQDHDVARLKKAKGLLELYVRELQEAGVTDAAELSTANERIAEIAAQIEDAERPEPVVATSPPPARDDGPAHGRGLIGGGAALLVVGVGAVVGGAVAGTRLSSDAESDLAGLDELGDEPMRRDTLARGELGDAVLIGCTVAGGVAAIAGAVLLGLGARKAKATRPRATAMIGHRAIGLLVGGRF
jgi:tetratricopeptide (TPR) repeat protein